MDDSPLLFPTSASHRRRVGALLAGLALGAAAAVGGAVAYGHVVGGRLPAWPRAYTVTYNISYPVTTKTETSELVYNLVAYRDEVAGIQKVVRDGVETSLEVLPNATLYHRQPRVDTYFCEALDTGGGKGPTSSSNARALLSGFGGGGGGDDDDAPTLTPVLPDLRAGGWAAVASPRRADGSPPPPNARAYQRTFTVDGGRGNGEYASKFTLWVTGPRAAPAPLLLEALAVNMWTGGHYDLTVAHFTDFQPGPPPRDRLAIPKGCPRTPGRALTAHTRLPADLLAAALPNRHTGEHAAYDGWLHGAGGAAPRRTRTRREYRVRAAAHAASLARVAAHNARPDATYKLAMTRFADWTPAERRAALSQHPRGSGGGGGGVPAPQPGDAFFEPAPSLPPLPSTVDWRGAPTDSPVKDQAMCGSCWAFGSVGALEAAHYRATGTPLLFSEQHLVDCAWSPPSYTGKYPNAGCGGGYQTTAFDWWFARGGAVAAADYPYRGAPGFCNRKVGDAVSFKGRYVWVKGGSNGLRAALVAKGPMTVSVDASPDDFALYRSGVYNNTRCEQKLARLDHAVLISGYGIDAETGAHYWLMKNTWGPLWGEGGYMRIVAPPGDHKTFTDDCGISAQPLFLELESVKKVG